MQLRGRRTGAPSGTPHPVLHPPAGCFGLRGHASTLASRLFVAGPASSLRERTRCAAPRMEIPPRCASRSLASIAANGEFRRTLLALRERDERALVVTRVDLPRPRDLLLGIGEHLLPLREPARQSPEREEHREVVGRVAHRLVDEP